MKGVFVVTAIIMLSACAKSVSPLAEGHDALDSPIHEPVTPTVSADQKREIISYVTGSAIRCGTVAVMVALGKDGERPTSEDAGSVRKMHESLEGFSEAQRHLKELRSAESECVRTAAPVYQAKVREAGSALKTEIEMIPE